MEDGFGAGASHADPSTTTAVDWPKVVVWLAMAVIGLGVWGLGSVAVFEAFNHL
jgi:hypothetical protein